MAQIPLSLLDGLERIPRDRPVALLMRHSARHPIVDPSDPYIAKLTEEGVRLAEEFGSLLGANYTCGRLLSSPVGRCLDTASAIARGAGWAIGVQVDERLSHPYIEPAWEQLQRGEVNGSLPPQVNATLDLLLDPVNFTPALDIMVTHDTIVGAVVGCLLKVPVTGPYWPAFLEGAFLWRTERGTHAVWRGEEWILNSDFYRLEA